jgi:predicted nucleic acid-binding protein
MHKRIWQLRANLTCYDASYVAVSEALDLPLATLDRRLAEAPGATREFLLPS